VHVVELLFGQKALSATQAGEQLELLEHVRAVLLVQHPLVVFVHEVEALGRADVDTGAASDAGGRGIEKGGDHLARRPAAGEAESRNADDLIADPHAQAAEDTVVSRVTGIAGFGYAVARGKLLYGLRVRMGGQDQVQDRAPCLEDLLGLRVDVQAFPDPVVAGGHDLRPSLAVRCLDDTDAARGIGFDRVVVAQGRDHNAQVVGCT